MLYSTFIVLLAFVGSIALLSIGHALAIFGLMVRNAVVYIMRRRGYKRFKMINVREYL